jgi:Reverse transcriptase (RNA-dependent DNA polymerase)
MPTLQPEPMRSLALDRVAPSDRKVRWRDLYHETELYKAAVRLYTTPLFTWRKALFTSTDNRDLYDFARSGLRNLSTLHHALSREGFTFRPGVALHRNFRGKARTLYIFPWEERLVDLLLYRLLSAHFDGTFSRHSYAYRLQGFGLDRCQHKIARILTANPEPLFAAKRDVANYFPSIQHDLLISQLAKLIERDDYLFRLLEQRIRFEYQDNGVPMRASQGIAFGTPIACFLANVYLTPVDHRLGAISDLHYFRYADDLLFLSQHRETIDLAIGEFESALESLQLRSKPGREHNLLLSCTGVETDGFDPSARLHHLGLEFQAGGGIRFSRDKFRKIRNIFRVAFRRKRAKLARIQDPRKRAEFLIRVAQYALAQSVRNVALVDYYLKHVTDEAQLGLLDRWLAEEVLSLAFRGGHKKSYFHRIPFRALRAMGLPSLVHRRRQIQHRQIEAPFFVWKRYQAQKSSRETAARLRPLPADTTAFSPCPEAVANPSSQEVLVRERRHLSKGLIEAVKSEDLTTLLELAPWKTSGGVS